MANLKSLFCISNNSVSGLSQSPAFYFGSTIFFIGFLLIALAVSRLPTQTLDLLAFAEMVSGVILVVVGVRTIRSRKQ